MAKKRKKGKTDLIWCFYCDRTFHNEAVLIQHQKQRHFKCEECNKKLSSAYGLHVHASQVHKKNLTSVPHSKPDRQSFDHEVFGMMGLPPGASYNTIFDYVSKRQKVDEEDDESSVFPIEEITTKVESQAPKQSETHEGSNHCKAQPEVNPWQQPNPQNNGPSPPSSTQNIAYPLQWPYNESRVFPVQTSAHLPSSSTTTTAVPHVVPPTAPAIPPPMAPAKPPPNAPAVPPPNAVSIPPPSAPAIAPPNAPAIPPPSAPAIPPPSAPAIPPPKAPAMPPPKAPSIPPPIPPPVAPAPHLAHPQVAASTQYSQGRPIHVVQQYGPLSTLGPVHQVYSQNIGFPLQLMTLPQRGVYQRPPPPFTAQIQQNASQPLPSTAGNLKLVNTTLLPSVNNEGISKTGISSCSIGNAQYVQADIVAVAGSSIPKVTADVGNAFKSCLVSQGGAFSDALDIDSAYPEVIPRNSTAIHNNVKLNQYNT